MQPLSVNFAFGNLALAHNGNLINAGVLRGELEAYGAIFQSDSDSEVIIHLIAHSKGDTIVNRVIDSLSLVRGAYSLGDVAVNRPIGNPTNDKICPAGQGQQLLGKKLDCIDDHIAIRTSIRNLNRAGPSLLEFERPQRDPRAGNRRLLSLIDLRRILTA